MSEQFAALWKRATGAPAPKPDPETPSEPIESPPNGHAKPPRPKLDAMRLSGEAVNLRLRNLGVDVPEIRDRAPRARMDPDVAAVIEVTNAERAEADAARMAELEAGAIDAREATPAVIRERLRTLGLSEMAHGLQLDELDEDRRSKQAPPRQLTAPERHAKRQAVAEEVVEQVILDAARRGVPVDTRRLDSVELAVFMTKRGYLTR